MARDYEKNVIINFLGKTNVPEVTGEIDAAFGKLGNITSPFAGLADGVLAANAAITGLSAVVATKAVAAFADFQDQMLKVKGIMGASEEEYTKLTALTRELGATTRYTASEAAAGMEFLAMAGYKAQDSMVMLPEILKLSQAAGVGVADAADIVTSALAQYGLSASETVRVNDAMTAAFTNSKTDLLGLGESFKYVGPVAKSLGLDIESTAAVLGTLGNAGYQAEQGGTAFRNILLALAAPAGNFGKLAKELGVNTSELGIDLADSANALKSLGVEVKGADGAMRPFTDIMAQLKEGLDEIPSSADRTAILMEVFGKRGGPQMAALLEQGTSAVKKLEDQIRSAGGVTAKIAEQMESGMGGAIRSLSSAVESVFIALGAAISEGAKPAAEGMTAVFRAISAQVDAGAFDPLFDTLADLGQEVKEFLIGVAKAAPEAFDGLDFSGILEALAGIRGEIGTMFDGVDLTTPEGLSEAIQLAVDSIESLIRVSTGMAQQLKPVFESVAEAIRQTNESGDGLVESFGRFLAVASLVERAGAQVAYALFLIGETGVSIESVFNVLVGGSRAVVNTVQVAFDSLVLGIGEAIQQILLIGESLTKLPGVPDSWQESLAGARKAVIEFQEAAAADRIDQMTEAVEGASQAWRGITGESREAAKAAGEADKALSSVGKNTSGIVESEEKILKLNAAYYAIPTEKSTTVKAEVDQQSAKEVEQFLSVFTADGQEISIPIKPEVDQKSKEKTGKDLEELVPPEKLIEVKTDLKIAEIEAESKRVQSLLEYKAQVDVAEIEAAAKTMEALADTISKAFESTGEVISDTMGLYNDLVSDNSVEASAARYQLREQLEKENLIREKQLELQKQLATAQIDYLNARRQALTGGETLIRVDGTTLDPALQMMLRAVIDHARIYANDEGLQLLEGLL